MSQKKVKDRSNENNNRRSPALALVLVILIAAAFFVMSDAPFIKNARGTAARTRVKTTAKKSAVVKKAAERPLNGMSLQTSILQHCRSSMGRTT